MIELYLQDNTNFENNGNFVIFATKCELDTENWGLEIIVPADEKGVFKQIKNDCVLKVSTFLKDKQLFRIFEHEVNEVECIARALPIFFDSAKEVMLEDVRPTNMNGKEALDYILKNTKYSGESNILKTNTAYYVYKNPIEAIASDDDNSFLNRWGGNIVYDNYKVIINKPNELEHHYEFVYGKNIKENGMQVIEDFSEVVTRIYPKAFNGRMMTSKYVDSPNSSKYVPSVKQKIIEFANIKLKEDAETTATENEIICETQEELDRVLLQKCNELFENGIDKPKVTINIDVVDLSQIEQYKFLKFRNTLNLFDEVIVHNKNLDIKFKSKVVSVVYNCIENRLEKVVIGNENFNFIKESANVNNAVNSVINTNNSTVVAEKIEGIMNALNVQMKYQKDVAHKQDVRAIIFEDLDPESPTFGAMCIGSLGFQISNKRNPENTEWIWSTFGTGAGFNANLITTGTLIAIKMIGSVIQGSTISGGRERLIDARAGDRDIYKDYMLGNRDLSEEEFKRLDINRDGKVTAVDMLLNERVFLGLYPNKVIDFMSLDAENNADIYKFVVGMKFENRDELKYESVVTNNFISTQKVISNSIECFGLKFGDRTEKDIDVNVSAQKLNNDIILNVSNRSENKNFTVQFNGNLRVTGTKNRIVDTDYGTVCMNAVESTIPVFEDFGTNVTDRNGFCKIEIDDIFKQTVNTECDYQVFLTAYANRSGVSAFIYEKNKDYFIVQSVPNVKFDWRIVAKQKGFENIRMETLNKEVFKFD